MKKLENRFGARELPAAAHARFQQATQSPTESLEDWADRVLTLASRAFRDLPEHYSTLQAITRFSQGLADKAVASQVSNKVPATTEGAINNARWCQYVHQAVYGKEKKYTRGGELSLTRKSPWSIALFINALQSLRLRAGLEPPNLLAQWRSS